MARALTTYPTKDAIKIANAAERGKALKAVRSLGTNASNSTKAKLRTFLQEVFDSPGESKKRKLVANKTDSAEARKRQVQAVHAKLLVAQTTQAPNAIDDMNKTLKGLQAPALREAYRALVKSTAISTSTPAQGGRAISTSTPAKGGRVSTASATKPTTFSSREVTKDQRLFRSNQVNNC